MCELRVRLHGLKRERESVLLKCILRMISEVIQFEVSTRERESTFFLDIIIRGAVSVFCLNVRAYEKSCRMRSAGYFQVAADVNAMARSCY